MDHCIGCFSLLPFLCLALRVVGLSVSWAFVFLFLVGTEARWTVGEVTLLIRGSDL